MADDFQTFIIKNSADNEKWQAKSKSEIHTAQQQQLQRSKS